MFFRKPSSFSEGAVVNVCGAEVKMRPKPSKGRAGVHQRSSERISALSSELISQWQRNAPGVVNVPVKRQVDVSGRHPIILWFIAYLVIAFSLS